MRATEPSNQVSKPGVALKFSNGAAHTCDQKKKLVLRTPRLQLFF